MADPAFDRRDALIAQRELIAGRAKRLEAVLDLIDRALVSLEGGLSMNKEEMFEVFGDFDPAEYEDEANMAHMVEVFDAGVAPTDPRAMDVAEDARLEIDKWFYPLTHEMHVNLGEMYIPDPRFTKHYDDRRAGLALWFRDAIKANAARAAV